mgnify:CR=1 FL=1
MTKLFDAAFEAIFLRRLFMTKLLVLIMVQVCASWQVGTANIAVASLGFWDWINLSAGIFVICGTSIAALFDKTAAQVQSGRFFDEPKIDVSKQKENG